jgi:hypothetical protein
LAPLVKHHLNLFLQRHATEQRIDGLTAGYAIFVIVTSTIGARDKVFNARLALRKGLLAEKAQSPLGKHEAIKWRSWHRLKASCLSLSARDSQDRF